MNLITLTTDFGTRDWFVGTMKGVILGTAPRAMVVDITHEIPAGDIRAGAFALAASYGFFPRGTVHTAVIDPGVGSQRNAVAVKTADYFFVGPDNGVLSFALAREKIKSIRRLENEKCFRHPVSRTFHGRDIFASVAAHLSRGLPFNKLGRELRDFVRLAWPKQRARRGAVAGEVVYLDRFGNAITNIKGASLEAFARPACEVIVGRRRICLGKFYQAVPAGKAVAVIGSSGLLEIAVNGGSAARRFGLKVGDAVAVRLR